MSKTRILSIFLSVCMILTCMAGMSVSASAVDPDNLTILFTPEEAGTVQHDGLTYTAVPSGDYVFDHWELTGFFYDASNPLIETENPYVAADNDYNYYTITAVFTIPDPNNDPDFDIDFDTGVPTGRIEVGTKIGSTSGEPFEIDLKHLDGSSETLTNLTEWEATEVDGVDYYWVELAYIPNLTLGRAIRVVEAKENPNNEEEPEDENENEEGNIRKAAWAEKPEYKPSGASGTAAPEEKPAEEPKDNDKQEEPKDNDKQEEPKDNDTTEIPEDKDTGNDGTSTVVDGSKDTNENPHTGVALGGLAVLTLAGAAMIVSKKRK